MKKQIKVRAVYRYKSDDGWMTVKSQIFKLADFDPVNGDSEFDWSDGSYLGFDDIDWSKLKWELL